MGNSASYVTSIMISNGGVAKLLHSNETFQIYTKPVREVELMVENPGEFVCDYGSLRIGQKIQALLADKAIERRQIYLLLLMDFFYSVLTQEEMRILSFKVNKALMYNQYLSQIFPVLTDDFRHFSSQFKPLTSSSSSSSLSSSSSSVRRSMSKQRSWKPTLETVVEAPCRSLSY